uniref:RING-type domain-containing protein n=1 Tax=Mola mola TaxID=94237 RepID=A0A3Q4BBN6_MOLML
MLRCRRCRKGILDPTSLSATDESSAACNIWHVNIDKLPEWILTSVQLAQWTVGKLNCQNCSARLGGFNFINRSECPCGQEATVHLNKSRVDQKSAAELMKAGTDEPAQSLMLKSQQFHTNGEASVNTATCHLLFSKRTRSPLHQELQQTVEDGDTSLDTTAVHQEVSDSAVSLRGTAEDLLASSKMSKREKNRMKALRRKQRKRERWLHDQQEKEGVDSECLTCAICLDVYFSPYSCEPCGHIFCELCLRTIAKNRQANTACPLCRTLISYTNYHRELDQKAKILFPNVYRARKEDFQSALCAKWPLPSCRKRFCCTFWGEKFSRTAGAGRRWHFGHGRFTLAALDFTDMRIWLFDICLVILYIHSVNWILAFLFLCFLMYYFLF